MTSLADYAAVATPLPAPPKDWNPVVEFDGKTGQARNILAPASATDRQLLVLSGLDPDENVITGNRKHRQWQQTPGEEWLHWWGFDFAPRTEETPEERTIEIAELRKMFRSRPRVTTTKDTTTRDSFVFVAADWQVGKASEHTIDYLRLKIQEAKTRVKELRKAGRSLDTLVVLCLGDLVEGCGDHYAQQTFVIDLDRRGQVKVARYLLRELIEELAPLFDRAIVTGIGGNHGENRKEGKSYTTFADNDDVAVIEMIQEVLAEVPGYEHVEFYIPDAELSACIDVEGVPLGFTHGHLMTRGGATTAAKAKEWWTGQIMGLGAVSNAQVLVTGHYHHLAINTYGPRTNLQAPACDGGSAWYADLTGNQAPDGVLTFRLDKNHSLGWDDLKVL